MSKKLTLNEKRLLNEAVTGETKRCLAILRKHLGKQGADYEATVRDMIENSPYIEFHPELLKRIPE